MYKVFKLLAVLAFFSYIAAEAMAGGKIPNAIIKNGIIEGATHYHLISGGVTREWGRTPEPVDVWHKPKAFFYRYNAEAKKRDFLGEVEVDDFDALTLARLDTLVDSRLKLPTITKAAIGCCIKRGRMVTFFDNDRNSIDTVYRYDGPTDILSAVPGSRLIYPRSLLKELEEVQESKPRCLLLSLLGVPNARVSIKYASARAVAGGDQKEVSGIFLVKTVIGATMIAAATVFFCSRVYSRMKA